MEVYTAPALAEKKESFRDDLGIVTKDGKRRWIYPKQPKGRYYFWRTIFSSILLAVLFITPFIKVNGQPFMLFDVIEQKYILFGMPFGPHDFYLLGLAMITAIVFIFLFTAVFGRLFCGWVCPQTVFMEMVFRKIDYWVEGNERKQKKINENRWTREKIFRKGTKYVIYFVISFLVSNMLLAWVIGTDALGKIISEPINEHFAGFTAMVAFTGLFYWIFIWFREQACILVCPYGRLQGVLLDSNSIVIAYDHVRGEKRGKIKRNEVRTEGDCIDCKECVNVCPTGIDIRNGTQLECVNCTACIDACDYVMERISKPRGLIRYDSMKGIETKTRKIFTPRVIGYSIVQTVLLGLLAFFIITRSDIDVTILRTPGMFYQEQPDGKISNLYDVKLLNKTFITQPVTFKLLSPNGSLMMLGGDLTLPSQEVTQGKFFIFMDRSAISKMSIPLTIGVFDGEKMIHEIHTTFLGPVNKEQKGKIQ